MQTCNDNPSGEDFPAMTRRELFECFLVMGLISFGGVLPFARRALVEQRKWLTSDEFSDALSLGQILPGPNVVNLSIMVGARFHGAVGAVLSFCGLMLAPLAIILGLATLYGAYGQVTAVQHVINGTAAASAGLVVAVGYNMLARQAKSWCTSGVSLLAFVSCGLLAWPLLLVLGVLTPISIFIAWYNRK